VVLAATIQYYSPPLPPPPPPPHPVRETRVASGLRIPMALFARPGQRMASSSSSSSSAGKEQPTQCRATPLCGRVSRAGVSAAVPSRRSTLTARVRSHNAGAPDKRVHAVLLGNGSVARVPDEIINRTASGGERVRESERVWKREKGHSSPPPPHNPPGQPRARVFVYAPKRDDTQYPASVPWLGRGRTPLLRPTPCPRETIFRGSVEWYRLARGRKNVFQIIPQLL